jgi:hypothetical protein
MTITMTTVHDPEFKAAFNNPKTTKVLATTGADHTPYVVTVPDLGLDEYGNLVHLESAEQSKSNQNLVRAIWYGKRVGIEVSTVDGKRFHLVGRPSRALVAGPVFEAHYDRLRALRGDVDLATVWILTVEELTTPNAQVHEESEVGGFKLLHLDRLVKSRDQQPS